MNHAGIALYQGFERLYTVEEKNLSLKEVTTKEENDTDSRIKFEHVESKLEDFNRRIENIVTNMITAT